MREVNKKEMLLLSHLRANARESLTKISKMTKMPVSTIFDKLKLYEQSLIKKHTTLLDFSKLGYLARANVMLQIAADSREEVRSYLKKSDFVNSLYKVNNGFDLLVEFVFRDMRELEDYLDELEKNFKIKQKVVYYIVEDIAREKFMSNPELMKIMEGV